MAKDKETKPEVQDEHQTVTDLQKRIEELEAQNALLTKKVSTAAEETEEQKIDRMCSTLSGFVNKDGKLRSGIDIKDMQKVCKPIVEALLTAKDAAGENRLPKHILPETIKAITGK